MKITGIYARQVRVNHRGNWVFVEVTTDNGIIGLGEASHSGNDLLLTAALDLIKADLAGENPLLIEAIRCKLHKPTAGRVHNTAISAIEQALWDIMGQHLGVPIRTLFGGEIRDKIRLYANINRTTTDRTPKGFALSAKRAVEKGFLAVKLAPFDELKSRDHNRSGSKAVWRRGVERVRAVRAAIGDNIELAVDCHGRMDPSEAVLAAKALARSRLLWLEEPVPSGFIENLSRVAATDSMPTASGENVYGIEGFRPFLTDRVVDVLMPDVKHDGGLLETKMIAAAARMSQLLIAPHNPSGPVSTAGSGQLMSTVENFLILEYAFDEVPWREKLLDPKERIEDGYLILPDGPGLGHRLNRHIADEHRVGSP